MAHVLHYRAFSMINELVQCYDIEVFKAVKIRGILGCDAV
jgi:hypothetical protein